MTFLGIILSHIFRGHKKTRYIGSNNCLCKKGGPFKLNFSHNSVCSQEAVKDDLAQCLTGSEKRRHPMGR